MWGLGPFDSVLHISLLLQVFEAGHALGWEWNGKLTGTARSLASHLRLSLVTHGDTGFCDFSEHNLMKQRSLVSTSVGSPEIPPFQRDRSFPRSFPDMII